MGIIRDTSHRDCRNAEIWKSYGELIKNLGTHAKFYPKKELYSKLADQYFLTPESIARIIRTYEKNGLQNCNN